MSLTDLTGLPHIPTIAHLPHLPQLCFPFVRRLYLTAHCGLFSLLRTSSSFLITSSGEHRALLLVGGTSRCQELPLYPAHTLTQNNPLRKYYHPRFTYEGVETLKGTIDTIQPVHGGLGFELSLSPVFALDLYLVGGKPHRDQAGKCKETLFKRGDGRRG